MQPTKSAAAPIRQVWWPVSRRRSDQAGGRWQGPPRRVRSATIRLGASRGPNQRHAPIPSHGRSATDDDKLEYYVEDESCWLQLQLDMDPLSQPPSDAELAKLRIKQVAVVCAP